jgi:hypothetical protein
LSDLFVHTDFIDVTIINHAEISVGNGGV